MAWVIAGPIWAQTEAPIAASEAVVATEVPEDEFERGSPRSAMRGYLAACRKKDYARAARYLDLRRISEDGPTLARHLRIVLSRTLWIDLDGLSAKPEGRRDDGLPAYRDRLGTISTSRGNVDILLQRVPREDGVKVWTFAGATVAQVPELWAEFGYGALEPYLPQFFFEFQVLDVVLWQWIALVMLAAAAAVLSWILASALLLLTSSLAQRSATPLDDRTVREVAAPVRLALATLLFRAGLLPLGLDLGAQELLSTLMSALFLVAIAWVVFRVIDVLSSHLEQRISEWDEPSALAALPAGRKVTKTIVFALAAIAVLDTLGFSVTALLAGLGVGGIAVALAAQKTIENLFGGVTLYGDRPVRVGDFCRFGAQVGTVEEIGLRSTRIRTLDRTVVAVPNAEFSNLQLENFARRDRMRLFAQIGVRYETTPDQLRYILIEIRKLLYAHERVTPDPARIRFVGFGAYSLDLEIFAYVDTEDWNEFLGIREDIFLRIMDIVKASGTGFAFPSQTLYLGKDEAPGVERAREITEEVGRWREQGRLFLPGYPQEEIEALAKSIRYPVEGSPDHRAS